MMGFWALQVGHQFAWMASTTGLPSLASWSNPAWVYGFTSPAKEMDAERMDRKAALTNATGLLSGEWPNRAVGCLELGCRKSLQCDK
jgi:hypothetical protein